MYKNIMNLKFLSLSENESFARLAVASFCSCKAIDVETLTDIKTAVSEAVTNSVVHAYPDKVGEIEINVIIEDDTIKIEIIDYGVRYINDISLSKSTTQIGGTNTMDPQVINYLEVPTSSVMKVVNWTYSSPSGWTTQTLTKLANDFENNNPGWVVLAGINGDFFDINSNGNLPKQTTGAAVNSGEVVRAVSSGRQVGFTNDGTTNSLIGGKDLQFTDSHYLTIYDENEKEIKTFEINKLNEAPSGDEISVYFSYYTQPNANEPALATTPSANSYIVESQERGYATSSSKMYGRGKVSTINQEQELYVGQFAVVTENAEVKELLDKKIKSNYKIELKETIFPAKTLKGKIMPAGKYMTLLITIGEGNGDNWWSILYPEFYGINYDDAGEVEYRSFIYDLLNSD